MNKPVFSHATVRPATEQDMHGFKLNAASKVTKVGRRVPCPTRFEGEWITVPVIPPVLCEAGVLYAVDLHRSHHTTN